MDTQLIEYLSRADYVPMRLEQIAEALELNQADADKLRRSAARLLEDGVIARIKRDRLVLPRDADLVSGTIRFRQSGSAVLLKDVASPEEGVLSISAEDTAVALHGDRVLVRLISAPKPRFRRGKRIAVEPDQRWARVVRILKRANETLTGTLKRSRVAYFVIPDDPRIIQDILVPPPEKCMLDRIPAEGDKVVVRIHEWTQRHMNPEGEIVALLGKSHEPDAEFKAILHSYKLNPEFPPAVAAEAQAIQQEVRPQQLQGRRDCRKLLTLTIDPDDAKDFDDALSVEHLSNGSTRVGIHIADVSAYVRPGTELDREARTRGNSTYLVSCVIPMLPHALSNGICSLIEGADRLTQSVFLIFDAKGKLQQTEFASTVIHSSKRLTYAQALAFLQQDDLDAIRQTPLPPAHQTGSTGRSLTELTEGEMKDISKCIRTLWKIAGRMRRERFTGGSLDLDMPEVKIYTDENGYADRIVAIEHDESHQLVEEYMLAANEAVARAFFYERLPSLSRVHDDPDPEKLNELREQLIAAGLKTGDLSKRTEVSRLLKRIKDHPQGYSLKIQFLRSLKQACYRASYDGHYGLAKKFYLHFTSPIRRYADLIVHRQFRDYLKRKNLPHGGEPLAPPYSKAELNNFGAHLSITERNSQEAERDSVKVKLLEFFERELSREQRTPFEAVVTDVKNHGMFIELTQSLAFGLVHVSTLRDDLYRLNGAGTALIGRRSGKSFAVGCKIQVVTERVDRFKRQIDFRVVGAGSPAKTDGSHSRQSAEKGKSGARKKRPARKQASAKQTKRPAAKKAGASRKSARRR